MIQLNALEIALLREACGHPRCELQVKVAGKQGPDDFDRLMAATVLQHCGYVEELSDDGAYAVWGIKPELRKQVAKVLKEAG